MIRPVAAVLLACTFAAPGFAQNLDMPEHGTMPNDGAMPEHSTMPQDGTMPEHGTMPESGNAANTMPRRGISMAAVEEQFGPPVRVLAAVGDPPITRWVYPGYTVYFENQLVIEPVTRTSHTGFPVQP